MGIRQEALERVIALTEARGGRSQLCVLHDGDAVLDRSAGCRPDDPFLLFSAGKPFVAVLVHQLAERGRLELDAPVARYWPAFAARGKATVTVRHVLQHRAGLPVARGIGADALTALSWSRSVRALERARPRYPAGEVAAYHILSYGFLLGEVVQRVTGRCATSWPRTCSARSGWRTPTSGCRPGTRPYRSGRGAWGRRCGSGRSTPQRCAGRSCRPRR